MDSDPGNSYPPIRRIVTGHSAAKVAKVIKDGPATNAKYPGHGVVSTLIWCTDSTPADIAIGEDAEDMGNRVLGTVPPKNGTRFAVIDFPPGNPPVMHRTETIDYVLCLAGEMTMEMDGSTITLKAGDVMVQRGTNHAWVNRGRERARLAFVLIDAKPLGIGHAISGAATASSR
ncbi:MAG: cupin domain-containing protein [Alphaproteobacteria bacterium]|nr:cupin domain-containing protein [Alphaproteobacteria bacterium]